MYFFITDYTSLHFVLLPVYIAFVFSFFILNFCEHINSVLSKLVSSSRVQSTLSMKIYVLLCTPVILLLILLQSTYRGYEIFFCFQQLYMNSFISKLILIIWVGFYCILVLISLTFLKITTYVIFELGLLLFWIFIILNFLFLSNNLLLYIFFFEFLTIFIIMLILFCETLTTSGSLSFGLFFKTVNNIYNKRLQSILSLLIFIWSSAIAMIIIFWSLKSLDFTMLTMTAGISINIFVTTEILEKIINYFFILFFLFTAILLKTAILPLHFWLLLFYKNLSILSFFLYLLFYYIYFIFLICNLIYFIFSSYCYLWQIYLICFLILNCITIVFNFYNVWTLRGFFAISSIINLFLIFIFMLVFGFY